VKPYFADDLVELYHGDARDVLPHLEVRVDLLCTDPPYGITSDSPARPIRRGPRQDRRRDFGDADVGLDEAKELVRQVEPLVGRMMTREASVYWWTSDALFGSIVELYQAMCWSVRHYVWFKPNYPPPMPGCCWSSDELCVHAYPLGRTWTHGPNNHPPRSVIVAAAPQRGPLDHPNQKPVRVIEPLITASSLPGQLVLDPFAGSGTTLVTARMMARRSIGIEKSERWCEYAARRLSQQVLPLGGVA
jgi:DNA modification methylase